MALNHDRVREELKAFNFESLFIEELGWDRFPRQPLTVTVDSSVFSLEAIAEKRGMVAFLCDPENDGVPSPTYSIRRNIENQVRRTAHEHLIIYVDRARNAQIWQWVRREPGRPAACREHTYQAAQPGDALIQKLEAISFDLDEEEALGIATVTGRARRAFDVERVTKRFYERFQSEHQAFLAFIEGIQAQGDREWYGSLMLNRLMFVYFIQKKGFLDGDADYLRNRLRLTQTHKGKDKFHSFYRHFLLRLFHDGLGAHARTSELDSLLGQVPYLNGGLFDVHELERSHSAIAISDEAFERIFDFFDAYQWHLDARPLRSDNEINPDVLGYIFEKYINQKQMGAYYTKEDITEYISKNSVVPFLLNATRTGCRVAFENPGGYTVWDLLRADPDRYIYAPVRHGTDLPLPEEIAAGMNPSTLHHPVSSSASQTLQLRKGWNKRASSDYALPTETWREVVTRRGQYDDTRRRLISGEVNEIGELLTLNLDLCQFAQDAIEGCEGPELLRAFWQAIGKVTVVDPACGSGAFLFAALNILEPLYEACLDRMDAFLEDLDADFADQKRHPEQFSDFRAILALVATHPNRRYFICKSIILNNLFGVDIMEEAVEICKLRLFLKLAAQVEPDATHGNLGIEPLPDIDFNIKAGNTLFGFASYGEATRTITSKMDFHNAMEKISVRAAELQKSFDNFRERQIATEGSISKGDKQALQLQLTGLRDELNQYLGADYGVAITDATKFGNWIAAYQPFHWFVEFYGIMARGGFDVVIGNPPYVEWSKITNYKLRPASFRTLDCGNIYAAMCERSYALLQGAGQFGMIVPISCVATARMQSLRDVWKSRGITTWASFYSGDAHPSILFNGVKFRLAILIQSMDGDSGFFCTHFQRWYAEAREYVFPLISYVRSEETMIRNGLVPKLTSNLHRGILSRLVGMQPTLDRQVRDSYQYDVYCHRIVAHFVKAMDFIPHFESERDGKKRSEDYKVFRVDSDVKCEVLTAILNSTLFYSWFVTYSDVYHCGREIILDFPADLSRFDDTAEDLGILVGRLMEDFTSKSVRRRIPYKATGLVQYDEFYPKLSKPIIDEIDHRLAIHYGFTEEELDFILNYDIKFRLGTSEEASEELPS